MADITTVQPTNVFPTTKANSVNKLITEGNLTKLVNNLLDTKSFLIPLADSSFGSEIVWGGTDLQSLIKIPLGTDSDLECVLQGYYFNLGPITDILAALSEQARGATTALLVGHIIIDTTDSNYPELFGEESTLNTTAVLLSPAWDPNDESSTPPVLNKYNQQLNIKKIYAQSGPNTYVFTLNSKWELVPISTIPDGVTFSTYTIQYVSYYTLIKLHVLVNEAAVIPPVVPDFGPEVAALGDNAISVALPLICKYNNEYYFPMTSYPKFASLSIQSIDGGIIE